MRRLAALCACLALGIVAVGCGGDDEEATGGAAVEETATTEATETAPGDERAGGADGGAEQVEVDVVDIDYEPAEVTVPAGTTVTWTNTGNLPHTVTKDSGAGDDFDSGTLQPGDTYEQTFETAGTIEYYCTIHANQRGSLTVE